MNAFSTCPRDVLVETTIDDAMAGRDPVLDAIRAR